MCEYRRQFAPRHDECGRVRSCPYRVAGWISSHRINTWITLWRSLKSTGVVLEGSRGPVPSLAEAIAGEPIRGSWWGHSKGKSIFWASRAVRDSRETLVCRLIGGKIAYVPRRLWPALVRLAKWLDKSGPAAVRETHANSGAHNADGALFPVGDTGDAPSGRETFRTLTLSGARR